MTTFTLSPTLNKNRVFILQKSELELRLDPTWYIYLKDIQGFKHKKVALKHLLLENPQYGANEIGIDRTSIKEPRYIRITDINDFGELENELGKTASVIEEKYFLTENDLLFARSGATVGKSYLHKNVGYDCFFAGYMIRFKIDPAKALPEYIFTYTKTNFYNKWTKAIQRATGQPNINAEEYKNLEIPLPDISIQKKIVNIYFKFLDQKKQNEAEADKLLASIDEYLLKALGIQLPKSPENSLKNRIFTISFNSFSGTRVDPNFHKSEYANIVKAIQSVKHQKLAKIVDFSSETWDQKSIFEDIFPYIEISEIDTSTGLINQIVETEKKNAPSRAKMIVRNEDILVSTTRPNRGAIALYRNSKEISIASTGFAILRKKLASEIDTEYLWFILKNIISLKQMEQRSSGGNYPAITQEELGSILIPLPPLEKQKEIANHITSIRAQAQKLKEKTNEALTSASQEIEAILLG